MTIDPDRPCPHQHFASVVAVNRIQASDDDPTIVGFSADITVRCHDCGEPFRWTGLQCGVSPAKPMCSVDETTMRAPMRPASADPDLGMSLPGFALRMRDQT